MKLESITRRAVTNGDAASWDIVFSQDGERIAKRLMLSSCYVAVYGREKAMQGLCTQFLRVAREAERDMALKVFGDDWKKHCAWGPWQEYEMKRLERAAEMWPEFSGAHQ